MALVDVTHDFTLPPARVFAYLAEHENLGPLFGATVERVRDGFDSRNGAGSVRRLRVAPLPWFEETVVEAVPDQRIVYRITHGSPLRGHSGQLDFSPLATGTRLRYVISFGAVVPGLANVVAWQLGRSVRSGLADVARLA